MSMIKKNSRLTADRKELLHRSFGGSTVAEALKNYKARLDAHQLSKGVRPWELVDVTAKLPKKEVWVGLEWENGLASVEDYRKVIDFTWANVDNFAVDAEGVGHWYGEFTFAPCPLSTFLARGSDFDKVLTFQRTYTQGMPAAGRSGWGIHANISTPLTRQASANRMRAARIIINNSLRLLSDADKQEFFGRDPYGYAYLMGAGGLRWFEFKLFQTTDCPKTIDKYRTVIAGLAKVIDIVYTHVANTAYRYTAGGYINVFDVFNLNDLRAILRGQQTPARLVAPTRNLYDTCLHLSRADLDDQGHII